jgi:hypothetical protein
VIVAHDYGERVVRLLSTISSTFVIPRRRMGCAHGHDERVVRVPSAIHSASAKARRA